MTEYYNKQLEVGNKYQEFVVAELNKRLGLSIVNYQTKKEQYEIGENKAGFEIKNDGKFRGTGNFWIEVAEKSDPQNAEYVPSGIKRKDNSWLYIIGDYEGIYIMSKFQLNRMLECYPEKYPIRENNLKTSRGYLLNVKYAIEFLVLLKIDIERQEGQVRLEIKDILEAFPGSKEMGALSLPKVDNYAQGKLWVEGAKNSLLTKIDKL